MNIENKKNIENIIVYDFDETIYDGDVTLDFYKYCFKKYPKTRKYLIFQVWALIKYILGLNKWTEFKENILGYFKYLNNIDLILESFWVEHKTKIKSWYLKKDHSKDVIISASPQFLLERICYDYLGVKLVIGTLADKKSGKISGPNCYGTQKVKRLNQEIKNYKILEFYSDSLSDDPLAKISQKSYIVKNNDLINWNDYKLPVLNKLKTLFFSRDFVLFILIGLINTFNGVVLALTFNYFNFGKFISFGLGYIISNLIAYLLNSTIIFKQKISVIIYLKFFVSYIPNFLIQLAIVFLMCNVLNLEAIVAYLTAAIIGVPVTFLCVKLLAFNKNN
ncbi:MAG: haloacid dehalogenase-like hydrolase, partial [Oscillospiraceae bacterium]|nr:haloacid dehalogenase-like hydrolase [Oscillospiraceae bacterium]